MGQDHRQCSLGAWMLPAGQEKQSREPPRLRAGEGSPCPQAGTDGTCPGR